MSQPKAIQYSDLQRFFETKYNATCKVNTKTVTQSEPVAADSYQLGNGTALVSYDVKSLTCRTSQKDLPQFSIRIRDNAPVDDRADLSCSQLESGGLNCYSPHDDFSFLLERENDDLRIATGHYVSEPSTWSKATHSLHDFIRTFSSGEFWIPSSW